MKAFLTVSSFITSYTHVALLFYLYLFHCFIFLCKHGFSDVHSINCDLIFFCFTVSHFFCMIFIRSPDINCPHMTITFPGEEMPPILQAVKREVLMRVTITTYVSVMEVTII